MLVLRDRLWNALTCDQDVYLKIPTGPYSAKPIYARDAPIPSELRVWIEGRVINLLPHSTRAGNVKSLGLPEIWPSELVIRND